jgi:hypothetical protein
MNIDAPWDGPDEGRSYEDPESEALERQLAELRSIEEFSSSRFQDEIYIDSLKEDSFPEDLDEREADEGDRVADEEIHEFIVGTVVEFGKRILEHLADIHGVGLLWRGAELAYEAVQWQQVAQGDGTVDAEVPIPLGPGVNLELSVPLASDQDSHHLPLTMCFAPGGGSSVGVLELGALEISPSAAHERDRTDSQHAASVDELESEPSRQDGDLVHEDAAEVVQWDLSTAGKVDSRADGLAALVRAAEQELPELRSILRRYRTRFVVLYDPVTGRVLWVRFDGHSWPTWYIKITIDRSTGRLNRPEILRRWVD